MLLIQGRNSLEDSVHKENKWRKIKFSRHFKANTHTHIHTQVTEKKTRTKQFVKYVFIDLGKQIQFSQMHKTCPQK